MASNCIYMSMRAWRECKSVLAIALGLVVCGVGGSLLDLFVVPAVLEAVGRGIRPGGLIRLILLFTLSMVLVQALRAYLAQNIILGRVRIRSGLSADVHSTFCRTSYPNIESPDYIQKMEKACKCLNTNYSAGEAIWNTMTDLITNFISFVIYLSLLAQAKPWMVLLCTALCAVGYFAGERIRS